MSNMIAIFGRANDIDDQGDVVPVPLATAYFYVSGSTTPLVVYADAALSTPLGTSVAADADGIFPRCYTDQSTVKIDVIDGTGVSLDGFPQDEFPALPDSSSQASDISATPVTGNPGTTVQGQLDNNTARLNRLSNATGLPISSGSSGAYAIVAPYTITSYAQRDVYEFIANHASVGGGDDTLSVDGVGAIILKKYDGTTSKADLASGDIQIGDTVRVKYDGANFVVVEVWSGPPLDEDDMASNSATRPPSQQSVVAYENGQSLTDVAGSRSFATTYTNNTGRPIVVMVSGESVASGSVHQVNMEALVDGFTVNRNSYIDRTGGTGYASVTFPVPNGSTYRVNATGAAAPTLAEWWELN